MTASHASVLQVAGSGGVGSEYMGPVTNVIGQLSNHMCRRGVEVALLDTSRSAPRPHLDNAVRVYEHAHSEGIPRNRTPLIQSNATKVLPQWALKQHLFDQYDVVHVHNPAMVMAVRKVAKNPIVYTCHTPSFWIDASQYQSLRGRLKLMRLRMQEYVGEHDLHAMRVADKTVALGDHLPQGIGKISPGLGRAGKFEVTLNGVTLDDKTIVERRDARQRLGFADDVFRVVCVGRVVRTKGVHVLLEALHALEQGSEIAVDIVGPHQQPQYYEELERLAQGLNVTFHGFVRNTSEQFRDLMCAADVSVMPSLADNQPTVILESLAYGIPVISSDIGASSQMIDATVGRLFPAGDAQALADQLRSLHLDPSGLAQMQARARDHVQQHFSWEAATQKYCALYDSLAD